MFKVWLVKVIYLVKFLKLIGNVIFWKVSFGIELFWVILKINLCFLKFILFIK